MVKYYNFDLLPLWKQQKWRKVKIKNKEKNENLKEAIILIDNSPPIDIFSNILKLLENEESNKEIPLPLSLPLLDNKSNDKLPFIINFPLFGNPPLIKVNKEKKNNFKIDINKEYDEINFDLKTLNDLIKLGKMYKENHNYAFDLKKLNKLIPTLEKLNNIIGMDDVKKNIVNQIIYFLSEIEQNDNMLHTVITGPPGVGKTLLGHLISQIYYNLGVVNGNGRKNIDPVSGEEIDYIFKIARRSDLIGGYLGHTAMKTQKIIDECQGGVLFIDEAYSLGNEEKNDIYSKECLDTINQNLTEKKNNFICIIAGYPEALEKCFFSKNEGLKRRFPFKYNINKYTHIELGKIFTYMLINKSWKLDDNLSLDKLNSFFQNNYNDFPNYGGDIETLIFHTKVAHSIRICGKQPKLRKIINYDDLKQGFKYFNEYKNNNQEPNNTFNMMYM